MEFRHKQVALRGVGVMLHAIIIMMQKAIARVWSAGGSLATARQSLGGAGTQAAGLSFGGYTGAVSAVTEEYDGTSWSAGGALATARRILGGAGVQSAGLSFGGYKTSYVATTEEYA